MICIRSCLGFSLCLSTCLGAAEQAVQIERLDEQTIECRKVDFAKTQEKNLVVRKLSKIGSSIFGTLAVVGSCYAYCKDGKKSQGAIPVGSLEELRKEVAELKLQIQGPKFGTGAWFKTIAWNFLLSPAFIMSVAEQLGQLGHRLASKVFYSPTVLWYMNGHTNLGKILDKLGENGLIQKSLVPGPFAKELEHHATMLDESAKSAIPVDHEYHIKRIVANFNRVVDDMTGLIAFMQYKADSWKSSSSSSLEISERARYLFNYTNSMSASLEIALSTESTQSDKKQMLLPMVKCFFAELEQVLVSSMRIEQEYQRAA